MTSKRSQYEEGPKGGTHKNLDRGARPTFLGLKFGQILFFWVGRFSSYFSGFGKISAIFLGLINMRLFSGSFNFMVQPIFAVSFLSHSIFLGFNFGSFYFFGFEFRDILFFWVTEKFPRTSIPVKEILVYPPRAIDLILPLPIRTVTNDHSLKAMQSWEDRPRSTTQVKTA